MWDEQLRVLRDERRSREEVRRRIDDRAIVREPDRFVLAPRKGEDQTGTGRDDRLSSIPIGREGRRMDGAPHPPEHQPCGGDRQKNERWDEHILSLSESLKKPRRSH